MLIVMVVLMTIAVICGVSHYLANYNESQYRKACNMMNEADYENAISVFRDISSYRDSEMKILECEKMQIVGPIMNAQIGDVVQFGNYNGITDWVVMDILENEYIILVGAEKIAERPFSDINANWQLSTIRQWLNDDYYNEAFSEREKSVMISAHVGIKGNIEWVKDEDNTTGDWVILPEYKMCPLINELGLNEKYDSMWISANGGWAKDAHDCVYFGNKSYSYAKVQVTSERRVFPEICIDISQNELEKNITPVAITQDVGKMNAEDDAAIFDSFLQLIEKGDVSGAIAVCGDITDSDYRQKADSIIVESISSKLDKATSVNSLPLQQAYKLLVAFEEISDSSELADL